MRICSALLILCTLASCSITAPRDVGNANMITLSAPDDITPSPHKRGTLKVDYPSAPSDLDTYRIAVAKADGRQDYFAGARWNEFLPSVLQAALIESLTRSGRFSYVDSDEGSANKTYMLHVDIEECKAVYTVDKMPPKAVMSIVFHLTSQNDQRQIATFRLYEETPAQANSLVAISKAFNQSFGTIVHDAIKRLENTK